MKNNGQLVKPQKLSKYSSKNFGQFIHKWKKMGYLMISINNQSYNKMMLLLRKEEHI